MFPPAIQRLIEQFSKFPTVGPRTAARFVFYLQELPLEKTNDLAKAIRELREKIRPCEFCFNPFQQEDKERLCPICSDPRRDKTMLCVVEKETDLEALEKIKKYKGLYFILGGTLGKLRKQDFAALRLKELQDRIAHPEKFGLDNTQFKEILIATNSTGEGEATALYLQRTLSTLKLKVTRLGRGLPSGGELEYADEETLSSALDNRK